MNLRAIAAYATNARDTEATTVWEPDAPSRTASPPTTSDVLALTRQRHSLSRDVEAAIIAIATRPLASHQTIQIGNDVRERELICALSKLTLFEAREVARRMDCGAHDDPFVQALSRLVPARRDRLRRFLADAPRRAATSHKAG